MAMALIENVGAGRAREKRDAHRPIMLFRLLKATRVPTSVRQGIRATEVNDH